MNAARRDNRLDYQGEGLKSWIGWHIRRLADHIDPAYAPRFMSPYSFTFERGIGIKWRDDGKGCPLAYLSDHAGERAHTESDSEIADAKREAETVAFLRSKGEAGRPLLERLGYTEEHLASLPKHAPDCTMVTTHHITCSCGAKATTP